MNVIPNSQKRTPESVGRLARALETDVTDWQKIRKEIDNMTNEEMTMYNMRIKEERAKVEEAAFALFRLGRYEEGRELMATLDSKPYMEEQRRQEPEGIPQMPTIKGAAERTGMSYEHVRHIGLILKMGCLTQ